MRGFSIDVDDQAAICTKPNVSTGDDQSCNTTQSWPRQELYHIPHIQLIMSSKLNQEEQLSLVTQTRAMDIMCDGCFI